MGKFEKNDRVIFELGGKMHRGRVTKKLTRKRRVVTDSGRRVEVSLQKLKKSSDRVLILESRLDRSLKSTRIYGPMLQQWLSAYRVETLYERVHTIEDLRQFLRKEGSYVATRFIHIMGHGTDETGIGSATLDLTFEKLDLIENVDIFKGLRGKIIIFSCCEIGGDMRVMETIKKVSRAAAIIAYRRSVHDTETNLCEALLYDRLIKTRRSPKKIVESIDRALDEMGIRIGPGRTKKPVMVCI